MYLKISYLVRAQGWLLIWLPCGFFAGVHYPSMSSLLSQKIPESERGFSFATITAGSHFG